MAKIRILVRYSGAGWVVVSSNRPRPPAARPYDNREDALSDAVFASRMLTAMGEDVTVLIEGPNGLVDARSEAEHYWLRH